MSTAIRRALYGKMSGDTTLNNLLAEPAPTYTRAIYYQVAPDNAPFMKGADDSYPYVLFSKQSGTPTEGLGFRALSITPAEDPLEDTDIWLVKAVNRYPSADRAEAAALQVTALLNDQALSISGGTAVHLRRESDVDYGEVIEGVQYHHAGSLFRLVWT